MNLVASIISQLFGPAVLQILLIVLTLIRAGLSGWQVVFMMLIVILVVVVPPVTLLYVAVHLKKVTNWDLSNRRQRVDALMVFLGMFAIDMVIIRILNISLMTNIFIFFFITLIVFFCITLFWKVSGHLSTATIFLSLLVHWYGWVWWPILFALPILAWSRVTLGRHTTAQTIGGIVLGAGMTYGGVYFGLV
jgi:membrane-associated phospholipid phosphatase